MFTWLRNKEKNIASTAIAMFVGSWLLLFCQTCFANSQDTNSIDLSQSKTESSCHTVESETDKLVEHYSSDDDHCLGVCDCDEVTASLNTVEKTGNSDKFYKLSIDTVPASILFKNKIASNLTRHILPIPERAIILPLQRYALLLI
ncbi:MAG: hypothetical protein DRQ48_08550 [Gammaproteobacteria bacterium]|nr:MAG: hypothetical protein DRQ58_03030 [Gammaproteobacteria bacterium]RKZ68650.1 MAG: hypothetical protein DRQ48_08550 [Gammaproteobacteria bacterium]